MVDPIAQVAAGSTPQAAQLNPKPAPMPEATQPIPKPGLQDPAHTNAFSLMMGAGKPDGSGAKVPGTSQVTQLEKAAISLGNNWHREYEAIYQDLNKMTNTDHNDMFAFMAQAHDFSFRSSNFFMQFNTINSVISAATAGFNKLLNHQS